jgi:hypothetical protein
VKWVLSVSVALVAVILVGVTWNQRADDLCRKDAPPAANGYSVSWEWGELAYVCDYRIRSEKPKRIGITDAFHGDRRRHGSDR